MVTRGKRRAGFTLVELLISVLLLTLLLGSIAMATRASLTAYDENSTSATLSQATRALLMRMRREIRTAQAVDFQAASNTLVIIPPANEDGITQIRYEFDPETQAFVYYQTIADEDTSETIFSASTDVRMTAFSVSYTTTVIDDVTCTQRAVVTMTLTMGGQSSMITCSAGPRRNQQF